MNTSATMSNIERNIVLTPRRIEREIDGESVRLIAYDGAYPGPVVELREGEHVAITLRNELDQPTNLHLHGIHLSPQVDNPHQFVAPGEEHTMRFVVPKGSAGTYWYHPHVHGTVTRQLFEGLAGALIVRGPVDDVLANADEHVLVLQDLAIENGSPAQHTPPEWLRGKEGNRVLVNGRSRPTLSARTGLVRLRLINASVARYYRLAVPGQKLHIIGHDGGMLLAPVSLEEVLLAPGERVDLLLLAPTAQTLTITDLPYARTPAPVDPEPRTLATLEITGKPVRAELPGSLVGLTVLEDREGPPDRVVSFGVRLEPAPQFLMDGKVWAHDRIDAVATAGRTEIWDIVNETKMDHPFHLHVWSFQVVSRDGVPEAYPAWRDVVNVRPGERVRIAIPFTDFEGDVPMHCHIAEHEDRGMMANLRVIRPGATISHSPDEDVMAPFVRKNQSETPAVHS